MSSDRPIWLHVDINSYFATLLQQENPALRGKPIGIVKDRGRRCVIAASKEAKKLGVKTGYGIDDAFQLAPNLLLIPAAFDRYLDATKRLKALFHSLCPEVEIFSLDEAFLDITSCQEIYPDPHIFGQYVQEQVKQELGPWVTCNVGIGWNRFTAKLVSEISPKGSVNVMTPESMDWWFARAPFSSVCGIGFRLEKKLQALGASNLLLTRLISDEQLEIQLGPYWKEEVRKLSRGEEPHFLSLPKEREFQESVGRSITGYQPCDNEDRIREVIRNLMEEVIFKTRRMKLAGRSVGLNLKGSGGERWGAYDLSPLPVMHASEMFRLLYKEKYLQWKRPWPVMRYSVYLGKCKPLSQTQLPWYPEWHREESLQKAVDSVNEKFGLFTLKPGLLTNADIIRPEVTGYLGDQRYQLSIN